MQDISGDCVLILNLFNNQADCADGSDEDYCYKVYVPTTKQENLPTITKPVIGTSITEVELKVLVNGAKIDLDIMTLSTDISITWKDPALIFYNLHKDPLANLVDVDSLNKIWTPTVF